MHVQARRKDGISISAPAGRPNGLLRDVQRLGAEGPLLLGGSVACSRDLGHIGRKLALSLPIRNMCNAGPPPPTSESFEPDIPMSEELVNIFTTMHGRQVGVCAEFGVARCGFVLSLGARPRC